MVATGSQQNKESVNSERSHVQNNNNSNTQAQSSNSLIERGKLLYQYIAELVRAYLPRSGSEIVSTERNFAENNLNTQSQSNSSIVQRIRSWILDIIKNFQANLPRLPLINI